MTSPDPHLSKEEIDAMEMPTHEPLTEAEYRERIAKLEADGGIDFSEQPEEEDVYLYPFERGNDGRNNP